MPQVFWKSAIGSGLAFCGCFLILPTSARAELKDLSQQESTYDSVSDNGPVSFLDGGKGGGKGGGGGGGPKIGGGGGGGPKIGNGGGGAKIGNGGGGGGGAKIGGGGNNGRVKNGGGPGGGSGSGGVQNATLKESAGGKRAPALSGPQGKADQNSHSPAKNQTPSRTQPGAPDRAGNSIRNTVGSQGKADRQPHVDASHSGQPGTGRTVQKPPFNKGIGTGNNNHDRAFGGLNTPSGHNDRGVAPGDGNRANIGNRNFGGNTLNHGSRLINLGNNLYQPSNHRHSGYQGSWKDNRNSGFDHDHNSGRGYGLGSQLNYGGYGSGWGWGLGNNSRQNRGYRNFGGYRPFGWGMGAWGLGSLIYNSGYVCYSNPYYANQSVVIYNYSMPIPVNYNSGTVMAETDVNLSAQILNEAIDAFRQYDYDQALDITNRGIAQFSDDAVLHEFRSLVLFARQDYQQSAATIHSVLALGPGWDWATMSSLYSDVGVYTAQLRALEAFTKSNPQDAASRFLLAYHYLSCGHPDAARRQLEQVVGMMPNDQVASELLRMLAPPEAAVANPALPHMGPPTAVDQPAESNMPPIDPKFLVGTWQASREDGALFRLTIADDATFAWSFALTGQPSQEFGGTYTVEQNVLVLERKYGGSLIAEITPAGPGQFNFRLLGAPDDDKGLEFSRN